VPLGAVLALSWCGEVSLGGILIIIIRVRVKIEAPHGIFLPRSAPAFPRDARSVPNTVGGGGYAYRWRRPTGIFQAARPVPNRGRRVTNGAPPRYLAALFP